MSNHRFSGLHKEAQDQGREAQDQRREAFAEGRLPDPSISRRIAAAVAFVGLAVAPYVIDQMKDGKPTKPKMKEPAATRPVGELHPAVHNQIGQ